MRPFTIRKVSGHSMMPTLPPKTMVWGFRWFNRLKIGDVIIFKHQEREKIKRIDNIDADKLYVLGDHKEASTDSRTYGWINAEDVIAKVIWPRVPKSRIEAS